MQTKVSQSIYTPAQAAEVLGCSEAKVRERIRSGQLKASHMGNVGDYVINRDAILEYLRSTQNYETMVRVMTRRILLVDRDPRVQDILRMELGRQGCEIKVATTEKEVLFLSHDYRPDIICLHLAATMRAKDRIKASIDQARTQGNPYVILYHNYLPHALGSSEMRDRIAAMNAQACVSIGAGVAPLMDAIRQRFGLKVSGTARRTLRP